MAKLEIAEIAAIDAFAAHLCERMPMEPDEPAKKYVSRIWGVYLKIANRPGVVISEEAARLKQFEKTVTAILKE